MSPIHQSHTPAPDEPIAADERAALREVAAVMSPSFDWKTPEDRGQSQTMRDCEAAGLPALVTPWSPWVSQELRPQQESDELAAERHAKFRDLMAHVLRTRAPWLIPLLVACDATVGGEKGRFVYGLYGQKPVEIPELGALLSTLPWAEDGEIPN